MAIERRERKTTGRRKSYSYRVKWRYQGTGLQQSRTVDNIRDAQALEEALERGDWNYLGSDMEVRTLAIIGAATVPNDRHEAVAARNRDLTVAEAVYRWCNRAGLSAGSVRIYNQCHARLGWLGEMQLRDVAPEDVEKWFSEQQKLLSSNTLHIMKIAMKGAFTTYDRNKLMSGMAKVQPSRNVVPVFLAPFELDALVAKAEEREGVNFALLVRLVGTFGLRWGEVMALTVDSLVLHDMEQAHLWVRKAIKNDARLKDGFKPEKVKTLNSNRMIPLTPAIAKILADHTEGLPRDAVLFKPPTAAFWNHRTFIYRWNRLCEATPEVPDGMRFHDLRHTAAKNMLERGVPIAYVSQILGHSKVDITVKEYGAFDQRSHDLVRGLMG